MMVMRLEHAKSTASSALPSRQPVLNCAGAPASKRTARISARTSMRSGRIDTVIHWKSRCSNCRLTLSTVRNVFVGFIQRLKKVLQNISVACREKGVEHTVKPSEPAAFIKRQTGKTKEGTTHIPSAFSDSVSMTWLFGDQPSMCRARTTMKRTLQEVNA